MASNDSWYRIVAHSERITQGDIILNCPLLSWNASALPPHNLTAEFEIVANGILAFSADVVVMTQACDLEHDKVQNVVLCSHVSLSHFRVLWEKEMERAGQNPTQKAWRSVCNDIADGFVWNQAFLEGFSGETGDPQLERRVVGFHEIFTIPRSFLESLLMDRQSTRLRLLSPYREHLSQAFARFFMRVGLPQPLSRNW